MTLSHASVIRLITKFGDHHDKEVIEWRDTLKQLLADTTFQSNADCVAVTVSDDERFSDDSDWQTDESFCSSLDESIQSVEAPPYSPIVLDGADSADEDLGIDILLPVTNEPRKNYGHALYSY